MIELAEQGLSGRDVSLADNSPSVALLSAKAYFRAYRMPARPAQRAI